MSLTIREIGFFRVSSTVPVLEPRPDPSELGVLIGLLDSDNYDQLYIEAFGDPDVERVFGMMGGRDGSVVFFVTTAPDETYYLQRPELASSYEEVEISSGGQNIDVLARRLVPVDQAARALYHHLLTDELDPALSWDRYESPRRRAAP